MEKQRRPPPPLSATLDGGPRLSVPHRKYLSTIIIVFFLSLSLSISEIGLFLKFLFLLFQTTTRERKIIIIKNMKEEKKMFELDEKREKLERV